MAKKQKKRKNKKVYLQRLKKYWSTLYTYNGKDYVTKCGDEYIDVVIDLLKERRAKKLNQSDYPLKSSEILSAHTIDEFKKGFNHKDFDEFKKVGYYVPKKINFNRRGTPKNNECVELKYDEHFSDLVNKTEGVAYFITAVKDNNEYLLKIGETRKTFAERTKSYNCGCLNNLDTASKTNIRILQTIIANTDFTFYFYLMDCSKDTSTFNFGGETSKPYPTSYRIAVQDVTLDKYINCFGKKPIANVQAERPKKNKEKDNDE